MKRYIGKYLMLLGGLLALSPLSGCKLDDPEIPTEELYLRNFIKQYGLIDPTQDFSSAKQVNVTLNLPKKADLVNIYAKVGDEFYRVGSFADLIGNVTLPVDISEATELMMYDVDGLVYYSDVNDVVDVKQTIFAAQVPKDTDLTKLWINDWSSASRTNGETGVAYTNGARQPVTIGTDGKMAGPLVDGCIDVRLAGHVGKNLVDDKITDYTKLGEKDPSASPNVYSGQWCYNDCEIGNTHVGTNVHIRIVNNDEKLSAYKFTFRTASRNDASVRVVIIGKTTLSDNSKSAVNVFMDSQALEVESNYKGQSTGTYNTAKTDEYTEWEVRTNVMPKGEYQLIIMGVDATLNEVTNQQYCGNWGFMKIARLKTAKDMRWILACEDLGTTDDFDFNDVVFSIEAINTNTAALNLGVAQWQVVEINTGNGVVLRPDNSMSKANSRAGETNENKTLVRVKALAAGGTLPVWLHFREEANKKDYIVCPGAKVEGDMRSCLKEAATIASTEIDSDKGSSLLGPDCNEWHRWFGIRNSKDMLNTGYNEPKEGAEAVFVTDDVFSLEKFCYIKYGAEGNGPVIPVETDEWGKKVLEWKWQQENAKEITYGFFLTVYDPTATGTDSKLLSKSMEGLPPQMFLIPDCAPLLKSGYVTDYGWCWPCERVNITSVYPNFRDWVETANDISGSNWFMMPKAGIVDKDWELYPRDPEKQKEFGWKSQTAIDDLPDNNGNVNTPI